MRDWNAGSWQPTDIVSSVVAVFRPGFVYEVPRAVHELHEWRLIMRVSNPYFCAFAHRDLRRYIEKSKAMHQHAQIRSPWHRWILFLPALLLINDSRSGVCTNAHLQSRHCPYLHPNPAWCKTWKFDPFAVILLFKLSQCLVLSQLLHYPPPHTSLPPTIQCGAQKRRWCMPLRRVRHVLLSRCVPSSAANELGRDGRWFRRWRNRTSETSASTRASIEQTGLLPPNPNENTSPKTHPNEHSSLTKIALYRGIVCIHLRSILPPWTATERSCMSTLRRQRLQIWCPHSSSHSYLQSHSHSHSRSPSLSRSP